MTSLHRLDRRPAHSHIPLPSIGSAIQARPIYQALLHDPASVDKDELAGFMRHHLAQAEQLPCDLPASLVEFADWVSAQARQVADRYGRYLQERREGQPRRFFSNKAHALHFLQQMAPSKLVDGAWLYGTLEQAGDWRYHGLIRTYLEELGDGDPALNHVVLYRKLLAEHDCSPAGALEDGLYVQGAVQLGLGHSGAALLPEAVGFNLGYEQLPLHLLITAFELNELGIDPYYFTLHVTIDNASSGHAHKAVEAVRDLLPGGQANAEFLRRVANGYRLNELGMSSTAVIQAFDLEREVVAMLEGKRSFGQHMHSDYCRLEGRTINEWLAAPGQSRDFLAALEAKGWIKRHQDPQASRFWQLIDGPGAVMLGVFSGYELQLLRDWIAGDWKAPEAAASNPFRARFRQRPRPVEAPLPAAGLQRSPLTQLRAHLAPGCHTTPVGLQATRLFSRQLPTGAYSL